jgi:hypothetical protein
LYAGRRTSPAPHATPESLALRWTDSEKQHEENPWKKPWLHTASRLRLDHREFVDWKSTAGTCTNLRTTRVRQATSTASKITFHEIFSGNLEALSEGGGYPGN